MALVGSDGALQEGATWPDPRFVNGTDASGSNCPSGEQVQVDKLTGLMWTQDASLFSGATYADGKMNWDNALTNTNDLNLCNYEDWRLPNINELKSIVNLGVADQATWLNDSGGFVYVQSSNYYSSSTDAGNTDQAWVVDMRSGRVYPDQGDFDRVARTSNGKNAVRQIWPVRGSSE